MSETDGVVHIVDDDADMGESLRYFLAAHWIDARVYHSAEAYLAERDAAPGCLLLDLRMPGVGGLELMERLAQSGRLPPTIVLTAHGDIAAAVRAMKLGAVDFLTKPHDTRQLLALVKSALERGVMEAQAGEERRRLVEAAKTLTPRERQILRGVAAGHSTRQIAETLSLQPKSVEIYRGRLLAKLGFSSSLELVGTVLRVWPGLVDEPIGPASENDVDS